MGDMRYQAPETVEAAVAFAYAVLLESALSFLGLGAQDPVPDWGLMVSQGQRYFTPDWWLVTLTGRAEWRSLTF